MRFAYNSSYLSRVAQFGCAQNIMGSSLEALLASIGWAEIPSNETTEAELRRIFSTYCAYGDIGNAALLTHSSAHD